MSKYARDLTPEEKAKSYSKYFYRPPTLPEPALLAAMNSSVDPVEALPLSRINELLNPGSLAVEAGWCQMSDGTGFVANRIVMPGVTVEMFDWWFAWFALEDLRYKLWYAPGHFSVSISEKGRVPVLNDALPMRQRRPRGEIFVIENAGAFDEKIALSLMDPEMFGFDMGRFHSPNVATAVCANCASKMLEPPPGASPYKSPTCLVYLVREVPGGIELRARTWLGWHVVDKIPYRLIPLSVKIPEFALKGFAVHNVKKFSNLASFLPQLYEEQKGVVV